MKRGVNLRAFDFDLLKVDFAECNAFSKDNDVNIDGLRKWLVKIA